MMLLTDDQFADAFTFTRAAFRLEVQPSYAIGRERADFERFLAGSPVPPPECDWLKPWLTQLAQWAQEGKTVSRVRVLDEPPSDYQQWLLWGTPWMTGESTRYMNRSTARRVIGLSLDRDWWLLDDTRVIEMRFTGQGEISSRTLVTDAETVAAYCGWRDIAVSNSTTAERLATARS
jgi:hypothetical protein